MAKIEITPTSLVVRIEGFDRFLALICGVAGGFGPGWRSPWSMSPGSMPRLPRPVASGKAGRSPPSACQNMVALGRMFHHGEWAFWDVHDPDQAIAIHLHDEQYAKLVIGVDDPAGVAAEIARAVAAAERRGPGQGRRVPGRLAFTMVIASALLAVGIVELVLVALGTAPVIEVVLGLLVAWLVITLSSGWLIPRLTRR